MTGKVNISIEIELAWGGHDLDNFDEFLTSISNKAQKEREYLRKLLQLCEQNKIPVTFDIVGHLLLEECSGSHPGPHPENWFENDPGSDHQTHPEFYAPDMVEMIKKSSINHDICTHTFSHIPCGQMTDEIIRWELQKSKEVHETEINSLVPPRHSPPPKQVLKENDIDVIRKISDLPINNKTRFHFLYNELLGKHPIEPPTMSEGVIETSSTPKGSLNVRYLPLGQDDPHAVFQQLPIKFRYWLHKRYLLHSVERAIHNNSYAHFWTHLHDIANDHQMRGIRKFIHKLGKMKRNGELDVLRMSDLKRRYS